MNKIGETSIEKHTPTKFLTDFKIRKLLENSSTIR